ncbi:N-acetyltransferase [Rhodococcus erythropolis]|uniref:N-acetyltransferase n=1 Tax=Rhodococcus erythropolis TaxID=1833 RepID=UPI001C9B124B|nr:N-acetyltransferase [Rhodococcus erythropolis]MBY6383565.1 N-acetyltransferase [Rhodococcus erythropolis]
MIGWQPLRTVAGLTALRDAYGQNMSGLVPETGVYLADDGWWIALTGAPDPSYNLALVHGGDVRKNTVAVVERVLAERLRTVVMLAGAGLDAATVLADAGWVCVGSSSRRALPNSPSAPDAAVRILEGGDLRSARQLAEDVFGIDRESATLVYQEAAPDRPSERSVVGLFELDTLQTAAMLSFGKPISTVWAAGTRAQGQRRGHGLRVLRQVSAAAFEAVGDGAVCGLASAAGNALYDASGAEIVEYWQMWSRPRWLLGS